MSMNNGKVHVKKYITISVSEEDIEKYDWDNPLNAALTIIHKTCKSNISIDFKRFTDVSIDEEFQYGRYSVTIPINEEVNIK